MSCFICCQSKHGRLSIAREAEKKERKTRDVVSHQSSSVQKNSPRLILYLKRNRNPYLYMYVHGMLCLI